MLTLVTPLVLLDNVTLGILVVYFAGTGLLATL